MSKLLGALLLGVLAIGVMGVSQTAVSPRSAGQTLLFDNATDAEVLRLGILFDGPISVCKEDIIAFGGEAVTRLDMGNRKAWIDAKLLPGGTLQVSYSGEAQVQSAYWVDTAQEKNKVICRWLIEAVWNAGDLGLIQEFMTADSIFHGDGLLGELPGVEGYTTFAVSTHTAFPDVDFTIEDTVAENDLVAIRVTETGTHTGPLRTIPATGASITSRAMIIYRFVDGMIQEGWIQTDALGMLTQIGILPPMGPPVFGWGTPSDAAGDQGTLDENKLIASRDPDEIWNQSDFAVIDEIIAEAYLGHYDMGTTIEGREAYMQYVPRTLTAFPDFHITVEELFAEGDLVVFRSTASGTHLGPLGQIPSTGKAWSVGGIVIRRMADGKIVELWQLNDMLSLLTQIGLVPPLQ